MLDKTTINFLKYLIKESKISRINYFEYCEEHKINRWTTIQTFAYLLKNDYILIKENIIYPTFISEMLINYVNENKLSNFFYNYINPYIQQLVIFLLGVLVPYLLKFLELIVKSLNI